MEGVRRAENRVCDGRANEAEWSRTSESGCDWERAWGKAYQTGCLEYRVCVGRRVQLWVTITAYSSECISVLITFLINVLFMLLTVRRECDQLLASFHSLSGQSISFTVTGSWPWHHSSTTWQLPVTRLQQLKEREWGERCICAVSMLDLCYSAQKIADLLIPSWLLYCPLYGGKLTSVTEHRGSQTAVVKRMLVQLSPSVDQLTSDWR